MKRSQMAKRQMEQGISKIDSYIWYVILLLVGVMPLIVRGKIIEFTAPKLGEALIASGPKVDFFTYYKWICLIILTMALIAFFIYKVQNYRYQVLGSYINIPVVILLLLAMLATLMSPYKQIALTGMFDRHEGFVTIVCYVLLFLIAANIKVESKKLYWVMYALGIVALINVIMGLVNFYGIRIIDNALMAALLVPEAVRQTVSGYIMATLNNPNYVAGFGAALTAYFASVTILSSDTKNRLLSFVFALMAFCLVLLGLSTGGFLALIAIVPLVIIGGWLVKGWRTLIPVIALIICCSGVFVILNNHNPMIKTETIDGLMNVLPKQTSIVLTPIALATEDIPIINKDHFQLPTPAVSAGSGRQYIWQKTIEMIKEKPLLGYGFDTYVYTFPQNDIEKVSGLGSYDITVDKPHNFFLGLAHGAGIPFLIIFLGLVGYYIYDSAKIIASRKRVNHFQTLDLWQVALLFFVITFLLQGIFNDSIIATTPIFWVIFGLSIALNRTMKLNLDQ